MTILTCKQSLLLPTLKAYPTPGVGGRLDFFTKMRRNDELKDTRSNTFARIRRKNELKDTRSNFPFSMCV